MLIQYLRVAWRNILKQKLHSVLNIIGLAVGLGAFFTIVSYINHELSYDKHHPDADNIYRIALNRIYPNDAYQWAVTAPVIGPTLTEQLPEVENYSRMLPGDGMLAREGDKLTNQTITFVDSGFFDVFHAPVVSGKIPTDFFKRKDGIILTQSAAKKYFGDEDPIGEPLKAYMYSENELLVVEAIIEDPPSTSHFTYEFLRSMESAQLPAWMWESWGTWSAYTYIKVHSKADLSSLEDKINSISEEHQSLANEDHQAWMDAGNYYEYFLQSVPGIHLNSNIKAEWEPNSSMTFIYFFGAIALLILIIAIVNFVNLATARASYRTMEVGIRKAVGAHRSELIIQFLFESTLITFIALIVALPVTELLMPYFSAITGKAISIAAFVSPLGIIAVLSLAIIIGLLAGFYPAMYLSHFKPVVIFQNKIFKKGKYNLRHVLVTGQFIIAIMLIVGTITVYRQMHYMTTKPLGFDKEQLISIDDLSLSKEKAEVFLNEVSSIPGINKVALSSFPLDKVRMGSTVRLPDEPEGWVNMLFLKADENYLPTMGFTLLAGRNFLPEETNKEGDGLQNIIVNAAAVRSLGLKPQEALNKIVVQGNADQIKKVIIGVVEDFNYGSLHTPVEPFQIAYSELVDYAITANINADPRKAADAMESVKVLWNDFVPEQTFTYAYYDEFMAGYYEAERLTGKLFVIFSFLAILICCLGLFGLMAFVVERRAKEVGIRKVMGAKIDHIIMLLSKEYIKLVMISSLIAMPVAWWGVNMWLTNFAYRVDNSFWILLLAGVIATLISWVTVAYYAFKSARVNPAETLKQN